MFGSTDDGSMVPESVAVGSVVDGATVFGSTVDESDEDGPIDVDSAHPDSVVKIEPESEDGSGHHSSCIG